MSGRSAFRAIAREALAADPRMSGFRLLSAWAGGINAELLPVIGVVTPGERLKPLTLKQMQRTLRLQVVSKRLGGDELEDEIDDNSDAIEESVVAAMHAQGIRCLPEDITTTLNGDGEQKIGTVVVTFGIDYRRPIGG